MALRKRFASSFLLPMYSILACFSIWLYASLLPLASSAPLSELDVLKSDGIKMNRHSFDSPLSKDLSPYGEFDWIFDKGAVPTKKYVMLVPSISNRYGMIWHKQPVKTNQFEAIFSFEFVNSNPKGKKDTEKAEGFALWFVEESYQVAREDVDNTMSTIFGYKANYKGLGVFFKTRDKDGAVKPSISAALMDGRKALDFEHNIPTENGVYYDFTDATTDEAMIFKLVADKNGISGYIRKTTTGWLECFSLPNAAVKPNGFIGFSGYSTPLVSHPPYGIAIHSLLMFNLNLQMVGEENSDVDSTLMDTDIAKLLNNEKDGGNDETMKTLKQLSRLLYQQISDQASREAQILRTTRSLLIRLQHLEVAIQEIKEELSLKAHTNHSYEFNAFHSELNGVKALLHNHAEAHSAKLGKLQSKMSEELSKGSSTHTELKALVQNAKLLEDTIHSRHSISATMTILLIVVVIGFGLFMWKRFSDIEKKHFL